MARWSVAATATFISRNFMLHRTVAPASLHTLAKVLSGPLARIRNLPEWGHAARCLPNTSNMLPHSHLDSVMSNGSRNLSKIRARKSCGSTLYSSPVGAPWKTTLKPGPEWDLIKWAWFAGHDWTNTHGLPEILLEKKTHGIASRAAVQKFNIQKIGRSRNWPKSTALGRKVDMLVHRTENIIHVFMPNMIRQLAHLPPARCSRPH